MAVTPALGLVAANVLLVILNWSVLESVSDANPIKTILPIGYALAGAVVSSRRPRNPIRRIFLGVALWLGVVLSAVGSVFGMLGVSTIELHRNLPSIPNPTAVGGIPALQREGAT